MSKVKIRQIYNRQGSSRVIFSVLLKPDNYYTWEPIELDSNVIATMALKNSNEIHLGHPDIIDNVFATPKQLWEVARDIRKVSDIPIIINTTFSKRKITNLRNFEIYYTKIKELSNVTFNFGETDDGKQSHFYRRKKKHYGK